MQVCKKASVAITNDDSATCPVAVPEARSATFLLLRDDDDNYRYTLLYGSLFAFFLTGVREGVRVPTFPLNLLFTPSSSCPGHSRAESQQSRSRDGRDGFISMIFDTPQKSGN